MKKCSTKVPKIEDPRVGKLTYQKFGRRAYIKNLGH